ncbi:MAG: thiamine phosphate synthase [Sphingomonadaceae bacterium]
MTDARFGDIGAALARLPRGGGVVFRHYDLQRAKRYRLFRAIRRLARKRRQVVLLADRPAIARAWGADGAHHRSLLPSRGLRTVAVHNRREAALAERIGADLIFVSPAFATRSHPGARPLGRVRLGLVAGPMRAKAVALGGMNRKRALSLRALGLHGWAGINAFSA